MYIPSGNPRLSQDTTESWPNGSKSGDRSTPWIINAMLLIFAFLIPLETLGRDSNTTSLTVARLAGILLVAASMLQPSLLFRLPDATICWAFAFMTFVLSRTAVEAPQEISLAVSRYMTWAQLMFLFHIAKPLLAEPVTRKQTILAYVCGANITAVLMLLGVGLNTEMADKNRTTIGSMDPNVQSAILGLAAIWLFVTLLERGLSIRDKVAVLGWSSFASIVWALLSTGSRGGLLALVIGLFTAIISSGNRRLLARTLTLGILALGILGLTAFRNESLMDRISQMIEQGDTAGREYIYSCTFNMWMRKPIFGWGLGSNEVELGGYVNYTLRDTHSIYLYALTAGGIVGAGLFAGMLVNCLRAALSVETGLYRQVALSGLLLVLTFGGTVTILFSKFLWLALLLTTPVRPKSNDESLGEFADPNSSEQ